jgi:virulence-associated protein VagC
VRLPDGVRFAGDEVEVRRFGGDVLIAPAAADLDAWFRLLDVAADGFMAEGRSQPLAAP